MCCCRCCMVLPVTSTATGESCYQEIMENNARHAGCAAGLRHVCLFIHLPSPGNGASYLLPPRSACSARRASSAPRPDKTEHCFLQFLPRGIWDLQHPPALIPQQAGLCLAGGGRARCPGAACWLPALGRSEQLTKAPCCSHPLTALGYLFKRRICSSFTFRGEKWS